jgi:hypothetical protein
MYSFYKPSEETLLQDASLLLHNKTRSKSSVTTIPNLTLSRIFKEYNVTLEEFKRDERRKRSLKRCHYYSLNDRPRKNPPVDNHAYVPELSARLENDNNITDGARRCARKIAELTYRRNRVGRSLDITVTYLMKALDRCRRTIQRYLSNLEREGYIRIDVVYGQQTRMCIGLIIHLQKQLFTKHHKDKWPQKLLKPGATKKSHKYSFIINNGDNFNITSRNEWAVKCMDGVFKSLMKTIPLFDDKNLKPI